jgi:beta-glucosidase
MNGPWPKGFYFGASTSAHQVEGGNLNNWTRWEKLNACDLARRAKRYKKLPSWDFIKEEARNPENYISGLAADHWNRFEEDLDLAKQLGLNAYRFSVEWSRIEPEKGKWDQGALDHYRKMISAMRERKLEPFLTVWHWTLPVWLAEEGGALSKNFPKYIAGYAAKLVSEFGSEVGFWLTLNEPEIFVWNSYFRGIWPPGKDNPFAAKKALHNLLRAHREMHRAMRSVSDTIRIGISSNQTCFESAGGKWNDWLKAKAEHYWNRWFLEKAAKDLDFIGLNYYFRNRIDLFFNRNPNGKISDMGWELYPKGIEKVLKDLARYGKPIYITENGLADSRDEDRGWFILETLGAIKTAIKNGADVRGYFHWSLLDNFEWDKGFWPKFGLIGVDRRTLERSVRKSAWTYSSSIKNSAG